MEDVRLSLLGLYEFLKNFNYIASAQTIQSSVYQQAQKLYKDSAKKDAQDDDIPLAVDDRIDEPMMGEESKQPELTQEEAKNY